MSQKKGATYERANVYANFFETGFYKGFKRWRMEKAIIQSINISLYNYA